MTFLLTICTFISVFFASFGTIVLIHTPGKNTELWGRKFSPISKISFIRFAGIAGWILFFVFIVVDAIILGDGLFWGTISTADWLLPILGVIIGFLTALLVIRPEPWMEKVISDSQNTLSLSELSILQDVDSRIAEASTIVLNNNGIFLFDRQDYNFFTAQFADYKLGDLQNQDQMKLLGCFFRQKYAGQFKYSAKVDTTYINSVRVTTVGGAYTSVSSSATPVSAEIKQIAFKRID